MADLDAELALFESEISTLVADPQPPTKKKKTKDATVDGAKDTKTNSNGVVVSTAAPAVTMSPSVPVIGATANLLPTLQTPTVMAPFLPRVGTLSVPGGVPMMPPPVPPPIFVPTQTIRAQAMLPPMHMPNFFLPHQVGFGAMLRQPPARPSATIESAPKMYSSEATSTSTNTAGQNSTAPVTFALASDIEAMEKKNEHPSAPSMRHKDSRPTKPKKYLRAGGGQVWEDPSLAEWDKNDFRIFCGDLGNEVSDELLAKAFRKYPSFRKAKACYHSFFIIILECKKNCDY